MTQKRLALLVMESKPELLLELMLSVQLKTKRGSHWLLIPTVLQALSSLSVSPAKKDMATNSKSKTNMKSLLRNVTLVDPLMLMEMSLALGIVVKLVSSPLTIKCTVRPVQARIMESTVTVKSTQ